MCRDTVALFRLELEWMKYYLSFYCSSPLVLVFLSLEARGDYLCGLSKERRYVGRLVA